MEFHEKLQQLRKGKGLTQEELAKELFVSRTAISKWESGRGIPNLESLKAIAKFFDCSLDELLSGEEIFAIAREDRSKQAANWLDLAFGLLDCGMGLLLCLPLFGRQVQETVLAVALPALTGVRPYLKAAYLAAVLAPGLWGILTLALQRLERKLWLACKRGVSLALGVAAVALFIVTRQPYAALLAFSFLIAKALFLKKCR